MILGARSAVLLLALSLSAVAVYSCPDSLGNIICTGNFEGVSFPELNIEQCIVTCTGGDYPFASVLTDTKDNSSSCYCFNDCSGSGQSNDTTIVFDTFRLCPTCPIDLTIKKIKAINMNKTNKDSWSMNGVFVAPSSIGLSDLIDNLELYLYGGDRNTLSLLDSVTFDACQLRNKNKRAICKDEYTRFIIRETKIKTSTGTTQYKFSGTFKRRDFDVDTVPTPFTVRMTAYGCQITNAYCATKHGVGSARATCKP